MSSEDSQYVELDAYSVHLHAQSFDAGDAVSKSYVDGKFTDLVNGAPSILDTLKEISDALGNDANLASTLTTQISNVQSALTQEAVDRAAADGVHDSRLDFLDSALTQEVSDRSAADGAHDSRLLSLESAMTQEQKDRGDADVLHDSRLSSLESGLIQEAADRAFVSDALQSEVSRAVAAEATKLDKSNKYSKAADGSFTVADQAYLYIGPNWRIAAESQNEYDTLSFEHKSSIGQWTKGLPLVKRKPASKVLGK